MDSDPVITCRGLTRRFGDVVAVDQLTLDVRPSEVFGLLGHNGAGKTTTIRLLNGILTPSDGSSSVLGLDPATEGPRLRRSTGVLTETPSLDERLTGRMNLQIYAELYDVSRGKVTDRVDQLLEAFELADRADEKVSAYSKGMRQRLALARALLHRPALLFLDEPTAALDPVAARRVHETIRQLSSEERRTVLLCTHNLVEAQKLCDRVAVLGHGRLLALGTPAELARQLGRRLRLEIEVPPDEVLAALEVLNAAAPDITPAHENGVVTCTGVEREAIPRLVSLLAAAGVRVYRVAPQEPSLEDVYFALHGQPVLSGVNGEESAA
jgi:ABC-2 type transport system ATP-binding protein